MKFSTYYFDLLNNKAKKARKFPGKKLEKPENLDAPYIALRFVSPDALPNTPSKAFGVDPAAVFRAHAR